MNKRETLPDGSWRLSSDSSAFTYHRLTPGALLTVIQGYDKGDLGMEPLDELTNELKRFGALRLFVDTSETTGVVTSVREAWTTWFQANQAQLPAVWIFVHSRFIEQVVSVAKFFSRTGDLMKITADRALFDREVERARRGGG